MITTQARTQTNTPLIVPGPIPQKVVNPVAINMRPINPPEVLERYTPDEVPGNTRVVEAGGANIIAAEEIKPDLKQTIISDPLYVYSYEIMRNVRTGGNITGDNTKPKYNPSKEDGKNRTNVDDASEDLVRPSGPEELARYNLTYRNFYPEFGRSEHRADDSILETDNRKLLVIGYHSGDIKAVPYTSYVNDLEPGGMYGYSKDLYNTMVSGNLPVQYVNNKYLN